jgi:hypothetical protein
MKLGIRIIGLVLAKEAVARASGFGRHRYHSLHVCIFCNNNRAKLFKKIQAYLHLNVTVLIFVAARRGTKHIQGKMMLKSRRPVGTMNF